MKKLNKLFCALTFVLPLLVANFARAHGQNGTLGPNWAMPPSMPANPGYGPAFDGPFFNNNKGTVTCESKGFIPNRCNVGVRIRHARVLDKRSHQPCIENRTWGWDHDSIWVQDGCRATFHFDTDAHH